MAEVQLGQRLQRLVVHPGVRGAQARAEGAEGALEEEEAQGPHHPLLHLALRVVEQPLQGAEHRVDLHVAQTLGHLGQPLGPGGLGLGPLQQEEQRCQGPAPHNRGERLGVAQHLRAHCLWLALVLKLHQVVVPDLRVGVGLAQVVGQGLGVHRLGRGVGVAAGDGQVALALARGEVEHGERGVGLAHPAVVLHGVVAFHRGEVGVLAQLGGAAAGLVLAGRLDP